MSRVIDLPAIRQALVELDRIAAEHPEICQGLGQWDEKSVAGIVAGGKPEKTPSERQAIYRRQQAAKGVKRETFFITPEAQVAFTALRARYPEKSRDTILCDAVINLMAALDHPVPPPPESPVDRRDSAILDLHSQRLTPTEISNRLAAMGIVASTGSPVHRKVIIGCLDSRGLKPNR